VPVERISPWLLRIELDRDMMTDKKLTMADIGEKIQNDFGSDLNVIYSDDNAEKLILRIRIVAEEDAKTSGEDASSEDDIFLKSLEENLLNKLTLRGIPGIRKVPHPPPSFQIKQPLFLCLILSFSLSLSLSCSLTATRRCSCERTSGTRSTRPANPSRRRSGSWTRKA
jgi:hypothetical protein